MEQLRACVCVCVCTRADVTCINCWPTIKYESYFPINIWILHRKFSYFPEWVGLKWRRVDPGQSHLIPPDSRKEWGDVIELVLLLQGAHVLKGRELCWKSGVSSQALPWPSWENVGFTFLVYKRREFEKLTSIGPSSSKLHNCTIQIYDVTIFPKLNCGDTNEW